MSTGFGHNEFGQGLFGEAWWGYESWWKSIPESIRGRDPDHGGLLLKMMMGFSEASDLMRVQIRDSGNMRDARSVRTRFSDNVAITIDAANIVNVSASESEDGRAYLTIPVLTGDLVLVFPGYSLIAENRGYVVRAVRKNSLEIDVYGDESPSGVMTLRPPSMIEFLGRDFAIEVDGNEPEHFQRSTVYDVVKWYNLKGTAQGVSLRASVAGFSAEVIPLYRTAVDWSQKLGTVDTFDIPDGSGNFYTSIPPLFPLLDQVAADVVPADAHCAVDVIAIAVTVATVTDNGDGSYDLSVSASMSAVAGVGRWFLTEDANPSNEYYLESIDPLKTTVRVISSSVPSTGSYTLRYNCPESNGCGYCRSHKVRLVLTITDSNLLADVKALEGAFDRLLAKLSELVPVHVDLIQVIIADASTSLITLTAPTIAETWTYPLFDANPVDITPADTPVVTLQ